MDNYNLNRAIAELVYPNAIEIGATTTSLGAIFVGFDNFTGDYVDYCHNWNDLMPLVIEHGIGFYKNVKGLYCAYGLSMIQVFNQDPQRALAECLLLVLQSKRNNQ